MVGKTPLEDWIGKKICLTEKLDREGLDIYQLQSFKKNIEYVKEHSPFYQKLLTRISTDKINTLKDIGKIPFTFREDIKNQGNKMICVSQDQIYRIVTLDTSGTTDLPKRIFFTAGDQELTIDFFHYGMSTFTQKKDHVLILLPGVRPGSIGDLLKMALDRLHAKSLVYGVVDDSQKVEQIILNEDINVLVGIPQQVLALSYMKNSKSIKKKCKLRAVLLSTDYVPQTAASMISKNWGCKVFEHYGMTEMGLGGGVYCEALYGYHLREADILFEIVDPDSGKLLEDGNFGEVVFTTLTRKGMPLIRYRTGDMSRFLTRSCSCGTILKTLEKIKYRDASKVILKNCVGLVMAELDEMLFGIDGIIDFDAGISKEEETECLTLKIDTLSDKSNVEKKILTALYNSGLRKSIVNGDLKINIQPKTNKEFDIKAVKKRKITDVRISHTSEKYL